MGDIKAGKWAIGVLVYFVLLSFILSLANAISTEYDLDFITSSSIDELSNGTTTIGTCEDPRYYVNSGGELKEEFVGNRKSCASTLGVYDSDTCSTIQGCTWDNITTGFWWWTSTGAESCIGDINVTYYNNGSGIGTTRVCDMYTLSSDEASCNAIGCTWNDGSAESITYATVSSLFVDLFTFDISFGFENDFFNNFIILLLIYVPLIILAVAIYFMLPIIH